MALSANTVWEVRTDGNDANGGGFVSDAAGVDRSQQAAAHATLTTAATVHTTTTQLNVPSGEHTVHANDIGNIFQLVGGSATAGFYQITAVDVPNNRWTVDRSLGTAAQTCPGRMGGAVAGLGILGHASALGSDGDANKVWVKSGTYTLTSNTANVSGGYLNAWSFASGLTIEGYQTTRGDRAARPVITAGGLAFATAMLQGAGSRSMYVINIELNGENVNNNRGFVGGNCYLCIARDFATGSSALGYSASATYRCEAINCNGGFSTCRSFFCKATTCGRGWPAAHFAFKCIAVDCSVEGFNCSASITIGCIAYDCAEGFNQADASGGTHICVNCIAYGNSAFGFRAGVAGSFRPFLCAGGSNTSGNLHSTVVAEGFITLTADPFVDAANGDFQLNDAAGGGALLRAAGGPFGIDGDLSYHDVGTLQHEDAGGAGIAQLVGQGLAG